MEAPPAVDEAQAASAVAGLHLSDGPQQQPEAAAAAAAAAPPPAAARVRCFSEAAPDATIHFQVVDLGHQLFVWLAVGGARLSSLFFAIQSRADPAPSVATLLPDAASGGGASLSQRLARRTGRPVLCSCNVPPTDGLLQVIAERRLLQELDSMGLLLPAKAAPAAAAAAAAKPPAA